MRNTFLFYYQLFDMQSQENAVHYVKNAVGVKKVSQNYSKEYN